MACKTEIGAFVFSPYNGDILGQLSTDDPNEVVALLMADPNKPTEDTFELAEQCRIKASNITIPNVKVDKKYEICLVDNEDNDASGFCNADGTISYPVVFKNATTIGGTANQIKFDDEASLIAYFSSLNITATKKVGECCFESFDLNEDKEIELTGIDYTYDICCALTQSQVLTSTISGFPYQATSNCQIPLTGLSNPFGAISFPAGGFFSATDIASYLKNQNYGGTDAWSSDGCKIVLKQSPIAPVPIDMKGCMYNRWRVRVRMYWRVSGANAVGDAYVAAQTQFGSIVGSNVHFYNGMYTTSGGSLWQNNSMGDMFRNTYYLGDTGVSGFDNRGINNLDGNRAESLAGWESWKKNLVEHSMWQLQQLGICGSVGIVDDSQLVTSPSGVFVSRYAYLYYDIPCDIQMKSTRFNSNHALNAPASSVNEWGFNQGNSPNQFFPLQGWTESDIIFNHAENFEQMLGVGDLCVSPSYLNVLGQNNFQEDCSHEPLGDATNQGGEVDENDE